MISCLLLLLQTATFVLGRPAPSVVVSSIPTQGDEQAVSLMRIDRTDAFSPASKIVRFDSTPIPSLNTMSKLAFNIKAERSSRPFQFFFSCSGVPDATCQQAKAGFERVGQLISNSLHITNTINVQAVFRSFCQSGAPAPRNGTTTPVPNTGSNAGTGACELSNTLGQAASAAYFSAKENPQSQWAFYPQALVKQLKYDYNLQFNQYDILAEFNADFAFYFRTSNRPIRPNETDFEFIVAHEITHGLGFDTAWVSYAAVYSRLTNDVSYLAPQLYVNGTGIADAVVTNIEPLNIWDLFVQGVADKKYLAENVRTISSFVVPGTGLSNYISGFEKSGKPYQAAQAVLNTVTSGTRSIQFISTSTVSNAPVLLHSRRGTFQPGSSIAHVDYEAYYKSADFLMVPAVQNLTGLTLDQIIVNATGNQSLPNNGIYGPHTLSVLHTIGWPIATDQNPIKLIVNPTPDQLARNSASSIQRSVFGVYTGYAVHGILFASIAALFA